MKMRKFRLALGFLMLMFVAQSCVTYEDVELEEIEDTRVENLFNKNEKLKIAIDVKVDNPNTYALKLKKADLNLYVGGKDLGKVHLDEKVKIPKKSVSSHTFVFVPESRDILKAALGGAIGIFTKGDVEVRIKGRVKGGVLFIGKWFDVDHKEKIDLKGKFMGGKSE